MTSAARLRGLSGALLLAAAVRGYLIWQYYCITWDGVEYIRAAKHFFTANFSAGLQSVYPPGYPLLIAAAHFLISDWELAGQCVSILCGVLLLVPLYWAFNALFDDKIALLACYLAAINPFLALYSVHVRSESPYLLLSTTAFYLLFVAIERRTMACFFGAGVIAGYAFLIRPEAIGFLLIVPGVLLLRWVCWREQSVARLLQPTATLASGFLIFALPYIVYLSVDTGRFGAISRKAGVTLAINLQESGLLDADSQGRETDVSEFVFTDYVLHNPLSYLKKVTADFPAAIWTFFQALFYSYLPFFLLGLFVALRKDFFARSHLLLFGFVAFYVLGFALILVKRRYALQAVPLSLAWVALGMVYARDWLRARLSFETAKVSLALIALLFVAGTLGRTLKPVSREKAFVRQAGWYLKERNRNGDLAVAAFDERLAFYAAARSIFVSPKIDGTNLSTFLHQQKADYFAVESKVFAKFLPVVARQPEQYGLVLEEKFIGTRNDKMLVFRVN